MAVCVSACVCKWCEYVLSVCLCVCVRMCAGLACISVYVRACVRRREDLCYSNFKRTRGRSLFRKRGKTDLEPKKKRKNLEMEKYS